MEIKKSKMTAFSVHVNRNEKDQLVFLFVGDNTNGTRVSNEITIEGYFAKCIGKDIAKNLTEIKAKHDIRLDDFKNSVH